jgi:hypothetical protein
MSAPPALLRGFLKENFTLNSKIVTGLDKVSYRNKQQDVTLYYNLLFQCFLIAQHVSSDTPLIIRSSKTVIAASGFTYVCGCRQLSWLRHAVSVCERPFALRCSDLTYRSYWGSIELILFSLQGQHIILYIINHLVCLRVYVFLQGAIGHVIFSKTKRRLLYLKTQSVPRSKHFLSRL